MVARARLGAAGALGIAARARLGAAGALEMAVRAPSNHHVDEMTTQTPRLLHTLASGHARSWRRQCNKHFFP